MEKEKNLSEKSMEEVVGGVTIDGKDVSDSKFLKTAKLSQLKARIQPVVCDGFEFNIRNKDGSYSYFYANRDNGGEFKVESENIPAEAWKFLDTINEHVKSFEESIQIPELKDVPIDPSGYGRPYISVEEVLEIKGINVGDGVGIGYRF